MTDTLSKQQECFAEAVVGDEVVLMDKKSGEFFGLKATAATIWALIDGTRDQAAIANELRATFEGPPETIDRELDEFLNRLREANFVT